MPVLDIIPFSRSKTPATFFLILTYVCLPFCVCRDIRRLDPLHEPESAKPTTSESSHYQHEHEHEHEHEHGGSPQHFAGRAAATPPALDIRCVCADPSCTSLETASKASEKQHARGAWRGQDNHQPLAAAPRCYPASPPSPTSLPSFIRPIPTRITPYELEFLERKGALDLPPPWLQDDLLRAYLDCFHPYMPLLDVDTLVLSRLPGDHEHGQLSLLLYQSVMFAGTSFVDIGALQEAGYETRKVAREYFFAKARVCCPC